MTDQPQLHVARSWWGLAVALVSLVAAGWLLATAVATQSESEAMDETPGMLAVAPGGTVELASLPADQGDVALGVTYVPAWDITNPTDTAVTFVVGQPQVLEGCCPGPVYADGELTQAGRELTVPPGDELVLQFPLQMHPGMDGPHHLAIPLASGDDQAALHVTGNFTASAPA